MQYANWQYNDYRNPAYPQNVQTYDPTPPGHRPAYPPRLVSAVNQQYHPPPNSNFYAAPQHAVPSRPFPHSGSSAGRDYLLSIQSGMSSLQLDHPPRQRTISSPGSASSNKPLPRLPPPPPLPSRPYTVATNEPGHAGPSRISRPELGRGELSQARLTDYTTYAGPPGSSPSHSASKIHHSISMPTGISVPSLPIPPRIRASSPSTPPKSFRPSTDLDSPSRLPLPASEPRLSRPYSNPSTPTPKAKTKVQAQGSRGTSKDPIFIPDDDSSESPPSSVSLDITDRSPARRKRATSEQPLSTTSTPKASGATRCAGFTRKGQPCQRLVKSQAPYLAHLDPNLPDRMQARYCKDHAGMICTPEGFYWRGNKEVAAVWVDFDDFIPAELGQQTQALLRMTMESPLTDKEANGYLYAYELRDLQTPSTVFFKVGRTDNVARRIGEWTTRCRSHTPTLRDIFPISSVHTSGTTLNRNPSLPQSFLPGALRQTGVHRTCPAVKRWERLVHLELADRAWSDAPKEYEQLKEKCVECQAVHREIFPLKNDAKVYNEVVMEVICRWERFVRKICDAYPA